jgi:hypothetical protein
MTTQIKLLTICLLPFAICLSTFAQGSLTPPGAPGATMLTLSQVEPRTPISSAPFTIMKPGSYYLTTNIIVNTFVNAIVINTNGVTLDLNGFTISSTGSGGTAILLNVYNPFTSFGNTDITISNGHITGGVTNNAGTYGGPGFGFGIGYFEAPPYNVRVIGVTVSGCLDDGIYLGTGNSTVVESCTVKIVGGNGIVASSVSHSTAVQCGNTAISADTASDCYGNCIGSGGDGLYVSIAAFNCYGQSSSGDGVYVDGTAENCYGQSTSSGDGVVASTAQNCYGQSNANGIGILATTVLNCFGYSVGNDGGVDAIEIAIGCYGYSNGGTGLAAQTAAFCIGGSSGTAIQATIANGCYAESGTNFIIYKYNMP